MPAESAFDGKSFAQAIREREREYFVYALNAANGNRTKAAQIAGLEYRTFCRKLKVMDLRVAFHAN